MMIEENTITDETAGLHSMVQPSLLMACVPAHLDIVLLRKTDLVVRIRMTDERNIILHWIDF